MSEKETTKGVNAQTPKKLRRGVSNQTQAVAQLKFHEKDCAQNGLFIGHLDEVKVEWSTNADAKMFAGISIPRLTFHFASNHVNATERRHVYQTLFPIESNVETIPGGAKEWQVNNVMNWIKHVLDIFYLKGRLLTEAEEDALSLPFVDFDENGDYVAIDPEEVANGYAAVFSNVEAMLNGQFNLADGETAKPCFKTADGKLVSVWMKLLRHKKRKNEWVNVTPNGDLGFDTFIGNGALELLVKDKTPSVLRLDLAKESITPKETKKAPTIGNPGMPGMGGVMVNGGMDMLNAPVNEAFNETQGDMPF